MSMNAMDFKEWEVPDVPLAHLDELETMDGSGSSGSNYGSRPKNQQTLRKAVEEDKSSSTSANFSSSLQDLVESFDKNVGAMLKDMSKNSEQIAPVKIRSQEEIMSESQFWWTLTGNYGNLPPIDFDRSVIRRKQIAALNLHLPNKSDNREEGTPPTDPSFSDDEEEEKEHLDFHKAVTCDENLAEKGDSLPLTADRVIEEIDEILQAGDFMQQSLPNTQRSTLDSFDSMYSSMRSPNVYPEGEHDFEFKQCNSLPVFTEEMNQYSQSKLMTIISEMEQIIQLYNEELVRELARRDEFEYEKEIRNKFITLLIAVQEKRRKAVQGSGKRQKNQQQQQQQTTVEAINQPINNDLASVTIPYDDSQEIPDIHTLEPVIKILQAMTEDSPQLPTLLTEYILNVICPTKRNSTQK